LAVTTAPLTITANDQSKAYGRAIPALTASYTGLVNGDTSASLTTQPTLTTAATAASHVGTYAITAAGAADPDYTVSYVAGSLAVTTAPLTITANDQSKAYGAALPALTAFLRRPGQRRHLRQPDHAADAHHHCDRREPCRRLRDHCRGRGRPRLHRQLRRRHPEHRSGGPDDYADSAVKNLWIDTGA
jgi:hypothetical protein